MPTRQYSRLPLQRLIMTPTTMSILSPAHAGATHDDQNHDGTAQTVCLLQNAGQHSHLSNAQLVEITFLSIESEERPDGSSFRLSRFNPSPFSQRAPPKV